MKRLFLAGLPVLIASLFFGSCNSKSDGNGSKTSAEGCDSVAITNYVLDNLYDKDKADKYSSVFEHLPGITYSSVVPAAPIQEQEAREIHIDYLKGSNQILNNNRDAIHYLSVDRVNLRTLWDNGQNGGVRLYFCKEKANGEMNIILVPVDASGRNVLRTSTGGTALVNKLEPCPDNCINGDYKSANDDTDLNREFNSTRWFKPNKAHTDGTKNHWWNNDNSELRDTH